MSEAEAIKKPMLGLLERLWVRWRSWIFLRRIKTSTEIERAIEKAKKLDPGTYLLFVRRGSVSRQVLTELNTQYTQNEKGQWVAGPSPTRLLIVEVHGPPEENVALYRIAPQKPL